MRILHASADHNLCSDTAERSIPHKIWSYWHDGNPPDLVQSCIEGWRYHNSSYEITIVNAHTLTKHISMSVPLNFERLTYQRQSDWARLALLMEHGGIWLDASFLVTGSLDFVHFEQQQSNSEGFLFSLDLFTTNPQYPVLDSWFIASVPRGKFITTWFNEFHMATMRWGNEGDKYPEHLIATYGHDQYRSLLQRMSMPGYMTIHIAAQKVMQIDGVQPLTSHSAEHSIYQPYEVLVHHCHWDSERFAEKILSPWHDPLPRLVKIRWEERKTLMKSLANGHPIDPKSIYYQATKGPGTFN